MPRAIAIETSGRTGSVAVVDGDRVVEAEVFPHGLAHAAGLLPTIDRLLRVRRWTPEALEQLYVSVGPGSFTGLRIAVTLAKTMALATAAKLVAVPTVEVLARNAPPDARHLLIVLDAKRDQIFTARFERDGDRWQTVEPAHLDTLTEALTRCPRPVHLLGEGLPFHRNFVPVGDEWIYLTDADSWRARAEQVAEIGLEMASESRFTEPDNLLPIYIRRPEAEEKFDAAANARSVSAR